MHFLSQWKGELILISHDRDFMDRITNHTMGIHREKIKKIKGSSLIFSSRSCSMKRSKKKPASKPIKTGPHAKLHRPLWRQSLESRTS